MALFPSSFTSRCCMPATLPAAAAYWAAAINQANQSIAHEARGRVIRGDRTERRAPIGCNGGDGRETDSCLFHSQVGVPEAHPQSPVRTSMCMAPGGLCM